MTGAPVGGPLQEAAIDALAAEAADGIRHLLATCPNSGQIIDQFIAGDVALVVTADTVRAFQLADRTSGGTPW